ncbi:class I mannose-6-phosphate isomerase [Galbitalea sp. SE-J8]|uniref:class I mannose-6-phosphate isomerase n=1 Tax=Galbitalea sp. SE-J8 TaxID=3054952 RepID=UPI00259C6F04|nr:class I mannose-6-phosphate isomerase [Galbitalea sp. SE-J8]MDM4762063.1 class I mannose-6-phosphate isomerase [Galbitalea sp. SE-J8]
MSASTTDVVLLPSNRPPERFYRGGAGIARFRGEPDAGERVPEDWVASTTTLAGEARLGLTTLPDGRTLAAAVAQQPERWLGPEHVAAFGADTRLLVKLLDAGERLPVHAHPDDAFAARTLGRAHGKAEAWYLLSGGEIHLGLEHELPRAELEALVAAQDTEALLARLHRRRVDAGDVVFVPPGVLHAIGAGILLVELQQPEDLSILVEWRDFALDGARDGHLGLGFDVALDAIELRARSAAELDELVRPAGEGGSVLPAASNRYFRLEHRIGPDPVLEPGFAVVVVLRGAFRLGDDGPALPAGSTALVPWSAGPARLVGDGEVLVCRPPAPR